MHRRIHIFRLFLAIILIAGLCLPSAIMAKGGDGMGSIALINTANYDLRLDIGTVEGPFKGTVPGDDFVLLPVSMYGQETVEDTGLVINEFFNRIYFDSTELTYVDLVSDTWTTNVSVENLTWSQAVEMSLGTKPISINEALRVLKEPALT